MQVQDDRVEPPATNNFAATVAITTADGTVHETIVPVPSGEPSVFPTQDELIKKFVGLVAPYYVGGEADAKRIAKGWLRADEHANLAELIETTWVTAPPK